MSDVKPWKNRKSQAEIKQILSATNINTVESLKEKLAAIEHERWSDWQKWCHQVIRENVPFTDALESVLARWDKQIETPYDKLSDQEKASDMEQVDRYWPLIQDHINSILDTVSKRLWSYDDYEVGNEKLKAYRQGWDEATKEAQNTLNAIRKELEEG